MNVLNSIAQHPSWGVFLLGVAVVSFVFAVLFIRQQFLRECSGEANVSNAVRCHLQTKMLEDTGEPLDVLFSPLAASSLISEYNNFIRVSVTDLPRCGGVRRDARR